MLSSYLIALLSGVVLYLIMVMDAKYIDPTDKPISPKIPLLVTLMIWMICMFYMPTQVAPVIKHGGNLNSFYG